VTALLVALGAAVGAPLRWWVDQHVRRRAGDAFPCGTLLINVAGSLVLGVVLGATAGRSDGQVVALVGTGFCGGFTTFSSFGFETFRLAEDGELVAATLNVVVSVAVGLAAAAAGWALGSGLAG
jgi:fluoride exporter